MPYALDTFTFIGDVPRDSKAKMFCESFVMPQKNVVESSKNVILPTLSAVGLKRTSEENDFIPATVCAVVRSTKFCVELPVPQLAIGSIPVTAVVRDTFVIVFDDQFIVLLVTVSVPVGER